MLSTQTDCYSLVWENPRHVNEAVRRTVRFERDHKTDAVPIEISSESPLEISSTLLNPTNDAYIILQTLAYSAKKYRSVLVLHKGVPTVRWLNASSPPSSIDLVIDARDVSNCISLERSFEFNRLVTVINVAAFVCITLMFVHVAARV